MSANPTTATCATSKESNKQWASAAMVSTASVVVQHSFNWNLFDAHVAIQIGPHSSLIQCWSILWPPVWTKSWQIAHWWEPWGKLGLHLQSGCLLLPRKHLSQVSDNEKIHHSFTQTLCGHVYQMIRTLGSRPCAVQRLYLSPAFAIIGLFFWIFPCFVLSCSSLFVRTQRMLLRPGK